MKATKFEIDVCGDCAYYGDCEIMDKFDCEYSLKENEVVQRIKRWLNG